jgi:glycosyltransferase involved in cell wall biosynthesis
MWLGKPVILADNRTAEGYIEDKVDGLVVNAGDAQTLSDKIRLLINDTKLAKKIGKNARLKVRRNEFKTLNCMQSIYNLAIENNHVNLDINGEPQLIKDY